MLSFWFVTSLVIAPFALIRLSILHKSLKTLDFEKSFKKKLFLVFLGYVQDVFVASQFIFVYLFFANFQDPFFLILSIGYTVALLDCLIDAFLYSTTQLRFEAPFFAFISGIKCFWDSAKEKKIAWLFPIIFILAILSVILFFELFQKFSIQSDTRFYLVGGVSFFISALSEFFLPKKLSYGIDNAVFAQQVWCVKKAYYFFARFYSLKKTQKHAEKKILLPSCEKYSSISSRFPLLKYTHGFYGEKQCDITDSENTKPHIVLFFMESFRAKDIGVLGGQFHATPYFDKLSSEGYLFSNFYANSVKTTRAVSSTLFGIPSDINSSEISSKVDMPFISLPYLLSKNGYHSVYHHNGILEFENQTEFFSRYGYKELVGRDDILKEFKEAPLTSWGVHDEYLMKYSVNYLEKQLSQSDKPIFLTMFNISNHHPWSLPKSMRKTKIEGVIDKRYEKFLYTMNYADYCLGNFIQTLRDKKLTDNVLFFILGDHGYPMGEHHDNHVEQRYLYEENVKVPLLILADGKIKEPKIISDIGSQIDLIPTIMDVCKIKGLNHARGTSLIRKAERQVFFHNPYAYRFYGTRKGSYKLIYTKSSKEVELYDLTVDKEEKHDISRQFPDIVNQYLNDVKDYHEYYKSLYDNRRFSPFELDSSYTVVNFSKLSKYSSNKLLYEIKKYPFILHLDLSHCDLLTDDTLKEMIKGHKELQSLNLTNCQNLTSKSLEYVSNLCDNLKFIDISHCSFSEEDINIFIKNSLELERVIKKDDRRIKA